MTFFSIIQVLIMGYILVKGKNLKNIFFGFFSLTVILDMNMLSGYFVKIGGSEIGYSEVALLFTSIVAAIIIINSGKINRKLFSWGVVWIVVLGVGIIHTLFLPPETKVMDFSTAWDAYFYGTSAPKEAVVSMQSVLILFKIMLYMVNTFVVVDLSKDNIELIGELCKKFTKIQIVYALCEVVTKYIAKSNVMTIIRDYILGVGNSTASSLLTRGEGVAIYGLTREVSNLAKVLFLFVLICILTNDVRKQMVWVILSIIVMFLSMSFSNIMYVVCALLVYVVQNEVHLNRKGIAVLGAVICISVVFVFSILNSEYYMSRISGFFADMGTIFGGNIVIGSSVTSSKVRMYGISETMKAFFERPLWGIGAGTAFCNSGLVSALANVGMGGLLLWIWNCFYIGKITLQKGKKVLLFLFLLLLPNVLDGGLDMIYALYNLLLILLIRDDENGPRNLQNKPLYKFGVRHA